MFNNDEAPNKEHLYGRYLKSQDWQDKLKRRATHMALDIPDDDMQIITDNRRTGDSTLKSLATLALGGLLGGGGLAAGMFLNQTPEVAAPVLDQATERVEIGLGRIEDYFGKQESK
ncbi:MAG TPA: hypothetical protein DDW52_24835 [Planctomycetaceae bacterium]|nr:hypothetical protein [Planctomycetaceae bacterium]